MGFEMTEATKHGGTKEAAKLHFSPFNNLFDLLTPKIVQASY